ncbi:hypothetical protein, partial [Pelagivirga sediminicola]|uniref:hypothetical protein n=1 Tax=Pelagivirga sediminicola TaxID=2170575 RepID=UPI001A9CB400
HHGAWCPVTGLVLRRRVAGFYSAVDTRIGNRELHVERHLSPAPEGWLSAVRTGFEGETVVNVGRWAVHFVNHRRG